MEPGKDGDIELDKGRYPEIDLCIGVDGGGSGVRGSVGVDDTDGVASGGGVGCGNSDGAGSVGRSRLWAN